MNSFLYLFILFNVNKIRLNMKVCLALNFHVTDHETCISKVVAEFSADSYRKIKLGILLSPIRKYIKDGKSTIEQESLKKFGSPCQVKTGLVEIGFSYRMMTKEYDFVSNWHNMSILTWIASPFTIKFNTLLCNFKKLQERRDNYAQKLYGENFNIAIKI